MGKRNDSKVCVWTELPVPRAMGGAGLGGGDMDVGALIYLWNTQVRRSK